MKTETSTHEHDEFTLKEKLQYGILGLVVIGGSFFIGRSIIRKATAKSEQKRTFEDGNPATYAQEIKMAFENDMWFGWGTDEDKLRKAVVAIPSKEEFRKVISSYQKLYARSLMADMKDDLSSSEYEEMLAVISTKPEKGNAPVQIQSTPLQYKAWARRLRAAFDENTWGFLPYGTDEEAIKTVFMEMPTQAAFWETAKAYKTEYGDELLDDLKGELEFYEYGSYMSIIMNKPKE